MKISNASKKVLASALSAAMVVAFAPTVAFGAQGDAITVSIDADNGSAVSSADYPYAKQGQTITLPTVKKGGTEATSWQVSTDGGVTYTAVSDSDTKATGYQVELPATTDKVTYKAVYSLVKFGVDDDNGMTFSASTNTVTMAIAGRDNTRKGVTYKLSVKNPNGVEVFAPQAATPAEDGERVFAVNTNGQYSFQIPTEFLVSGAYTATITADGEKIAEATMNIVKLTYKTSSTDNGTAIYYATNDTNAAVSALSTAVSGGSWLKDGYSFTADAASLAALRGDVTIVKAGDKDITVTTTGYGSRALTFGLPGVTLDKKGDTYAYELKDPSGAVIYSGSTTAIADSQSVAAASSFAVTFDQKASGNRVYNNAAETAGDYVMTVTVTKKDETEPALSGKAKVTLTEIKYSAGDNGKLGTAYKDNADQFVSTVNQTAPGATSNDIVPNSGYTFEGWDLNGNGKLDTNKDKNIIQAGKVNTFTATYRAVDYAKWVADPTIENATYDSAKKQWTVKLASATAGAKLYVGTADSAVTTAYDASKGYENAPMTFYAQAVRDTGKTDSALSHDSKVVKVTRDTSAWDVVANGTAAVNQNVGKEKVKWAEKDGVAAAIATGKAAVEAAGYKTGDEMNAITDGNAKAVYEAVVAQANAELAKYANGALVAVGDKAYTATAKSLETAAKAIEKAGKDLSANIAAAAEGTSVASYYATAISGVVAAANTALNAATEDKTVTAADVNAAQAVTTAIAALPTEVTAANAVEAKAAAEKAIADYASLSAGAQKLVSSADYAKAVAAIEAADEAIATADKAAVAKVKGKTVKAKASKKTTAKLTKVTSESGAVSTFKKTSGNAKITVSKSGKITVKKGLKKGKKYTAKVKATIGASTKTVKVVVKVTK